MAAGLQVVLKNDLMTGLAQPEQLVGYRGDADDPTPCC